MSILVWIFVLGLVPGVAVAAAQQQQPENWVEPNTGMEFVYVPGGCYDMGDTFGDGRPEELPVHEVCVGEFYMAMHEVTLGQWQELVESNLWQFQMGDNYPVEQVSWYDAQVYIDRLNKLTSGRHFRLPSEAEWEYAARSGGKAEKYAGGENVDNFAWYGVKGGGTTHAVGTKEPNGLGLFDMSGNVWEWVQDWYSDEYYKTSPKNNPPGPESGSYKVSRGGGGFARAMRMRTTYRGWIPPDTRFSYQGFRLVMIPRPKPVEKKQEEKSRRRR